MRSLSRIFALGGRGGGGAGAAGVALESVLFYSQNKKSHKFNDFMCCQRVTCSF